jgi:hypothetical protein
VCGVLFAGFGHRELPGIWARLLSLAQIQVGGHISFGAWDYVSFAVGAELGPGHWSPGLAQTLRSFQEYLTPVYVGLIVGGLWLALRRPRTWTLLGALAYLVAAAFYYARCVRDPWSGQIGHTWNLFKLSQYAFPLLCAFLIFGFRRLHRRLPLPPGFARSGGLLLVSGMVAIHWAWSAEAGFSMQALVPAERPLEAVPELRRRLLALPEGTLFVLGRPAAQHACLGDTLALLAYPRPMMSDWEGTYHVPPVPEAPATIRRLLSNPGPTPVVALVLGKPPFSSEGAERVGPGVTWLHDLAPRILRLDEHGVVSASRPVGSFEWTGRSRLRMTVFSPRATHATLELTVRPRAPRPGAPHEWIEVWTAPRELRGPALRGALDPASRLEIDIDGAEEALRIPVRLEPGTNTVAFARRGSDVPPETDGVLLSITGARLLEAR